MSSPKPPGVKWLRPGMMVIGAVVVLFGAAAWFLTLETVGVANPDNEQQVTMGKRIYEANCASCHGVNLEGQATWRIRKPDGRLPAPPHDETGHTWHHPDVGLFRITKVGLKPPLAPEGYESDMPSFGDILTDEEIWAVLAFIKSTWPENIKTRQHEMSKGALQ